MMAMVFAFVMVAAGAFVQTTIGFGFAIVIAPALYLIQPAYIPGPIALVGLVIAILNAYRYRTSISFHGVGLALLGRVPGTAAGAALLLVVSAHWLSLWLGLVVLIAVIVSLLPHRLEPTPTRLLIAGFLSGFMGTSSSIGGPPMALLLQHQAANHIRANMAAFFIVSGFMTLIALRLVGHMTLYQVGLALPLIPAAIIGHLIANRVIDRINKQQMRWLSLVLCSLSAASAIGHFFYQQFWG